MTQTPCKLLVAIPMKDPANAKTRLGILLSPHQRAQLALMLFRNVVECVKMAKTQLPDHHIDLAVISSSPAIRRLSGQLGVKWIDDGKASGLSVAVDYAANAASNDGYGKLCILPGDLSDPATSDIVQLLEHAVSDLDAVICPSHDMGTNALLLPVPSPVTFQYGEKSFHLHYRALVDAGLLTAVLPLNSLRRDVDTIHDWHDLKVRRPDMVTWSEMR